MFEFIRKLFQKKEPLTPNHISSGKLITQLADQKNLVDGVPTWDHAEAGKHDLELMVRCCYAELETMERTGLVAAPYYFERAAILLRKAKNYRQEVEICERYVSAVEAFYATQDLTQVADVRRGPRYAAIQHRLIRARELLVR